MDAAYRQATGHGTLNKAIQTATTGDLQRAAMFLEEHAKCGRAVRTSAPKLAVLKQMRGKRRSILLSHGNVCVAH